MSEPFTRITSLVIPLPINNIDTDQIIPARYLKGTDKRGLAEGLFASWRYLPDGSPNPDFPLNQEIYRGCRILLAGENFGCGSSREHAVWALVQWGLRAVISSSFGDIFRNNALKNGLLPVEINPSSHTLLLALAKENTPLTVTIDLESQSVSLPNGAKTSFPIDPFSKRCLLAGVDELGYLLQCETQISAFESHRQGNYFAGLNGFLR